MKLRTLLRGSKSPTLARADATDHAERLLAESFRLLGQVCSKMAELVEAQRLERRGYEQQGSFLERLDENGRRSGRDEGDGAGVSARPPGGARRPGTS